MREGGDSWNCFGDILLISQKQITYSKDNDSMSGIDILMITYNRPEYTRQSLGRLLDSCDSSCRVWIWHNGDHQETLDVVRSFQSHKNVHRFYHSQENVKLRPATNWLWQNAQGDYVAKVDDDCLVPLNWLSVLTGAHRENPAFGVIGCWHFMPEDFLPSIASKKICAYAGNHQLMKNCWLGGSGYLMKTACLQAQGVLQHDESFTHYCIRLAAAGWVNGWYFPFLYQEHMDDPRAPHTKLLTDADFAKWIPLSAQTFQAKSLDAWDKQLRRSARTLQEAPYDPHLYSAFRKKLRTYTNKVRGRLGIEKICW